MWQKIEIGVDFCFCCMLKVTVYHSFLIIIYHSFHAYLLALLTPHNLDNWAVHLVSTISCQHEVEMVVALHLDAALK